MSDIFKAAKKDLKEVERRLNLHRPDIAALRPGAVLMGRVDDLRYVFGVVENLVGVIEHLCLENRVLEHKIKRS